VFKYPVDPTTNFVKRVVGLAGDTLEMRDGTLIRNGVALTERYVRHTRPGSDPVDEEFRWQRDFLVTSASASGVPASPATRRGYNPSRNNWGPLLVPRQHYFVLGDNRDNSLDSRYWGFVPDSLVRGRPLFVYYSYEPDSRVSFDWLTRIRWSRLGARIE
jgi:signal peptidase I